MANMGENGGQNDVAGTDGFDRQWMNSEEEDGDLRDIIAIRDFAYKAFDKLDKNGNGFIEQTELAYAQSSAPAGSKEKSFITFLLNNQEAISNMVAEDHGPQLGLSRGDLESYFALISRLLG